MLARVQDHRSGCAGKDMLARAYLLRELLRDADAQRTLAVGEEKRRQRAPGDATLYLPGLAFRSATRSCMV